MSEDSYMVVKMGTLYAGEYLGTVVAGDWSRLDESQKLKESGKGRWQLDHHGITFLRDHLNVPIMIPYADMIDVHESAWLGEKRENRQHEVKLTWMKGAFESTLPRRTDNLHLYSGFVFSEDGEFTQAVIKKVLAQLRWKTTISLTLDDMVRR